jgi:hypothetical protein
VFDKYFGSSDKNGNREDTVCAVGFEPNPRHAPLLKETEQVVETKLKSPVKVFSKILAILNDLFGSATLRPLFQ